LRQHHPTHPKEEVITLCSVKITQKKQQQQQLQQQQQQQLQQQQQPQHK
jgi:hypothetical protein